MWTSEQADYFSLSCCLRQAGLKLIKVIFKKSTSFVAEYSLKVINKNFVEHFKGGNLFNCEHVVINKVFEIGRASCRERVCLYV